MMSTQFPQETAQETLLRATLREHAPQTIDLEQGWAKISAQLSTRAEQAVTTRVLHWFPRQSQSERRFVRRWQVLALAAVLLMVLIGGGLFGPFSNLLGGNQGVYAQVNQRQQDQGITITLARAYANLRGTILTFKITLPSQLANNFAWPKTLTLTYRHHTVPERDRGVASLNTKTYAHGSNLPFSAVNPPANTQEVTLTWHITQLALRLYNASTHRLGDLVVIKGNWTFTFTIPFHNDDLAPVGPSE